MENSFGRRYRNVRPHSLPAESHSFVGMARETAAMPPACGEMVVENPLSRVGHTQVAAFGAFSKTPPTVEPVEENLSPRGGYTHTEPSK